MTRSVFGSSQQAIGWSMENLAASFGVENIDLALSAPLAPRSSEAVAAIGEVLAEAGETYARETGRSFVTVRDLAEAAERRDVAVVLCGFEHLSIAGLEAASERQSGALGVIPVTGRAAPEASRTLCALKFAKAAKCGARISHYPLAPPFLRRTSNVIIAGGVDQARVQSLWTKPAALKLIQTHSDGIDAYLGAEAVSCAIHSWMPERLATPDCVARGRCHRLARELDAEQLRESVIDPTRVAAGVLVWDACFALPHSEATFSPATYLLYWLWKHAAVGSVVTNFEIALTTIQFLEDVGDLIARSSDVGSAVQSVAMGESFQQFGRRFVILGDPALATKAPRSALQDVATPSARRLSQTRSLQTQSALVYAMRASDRRDLADAYGRGDGGADEATIKWILARGKIFDLWTGVGDVRLIDERSRCPNCEGRTRHFENGSFRTARILKSCARCGIVSDTERGIAAALQIGAEHVRLSLPKPFGARRAAIQYWRGTPETSEAFDWPINMGSPASSCPVLRVGAVRAQRISVVLLHDADATIVSAFDRPLRDACVQELI